MPIAIPSECLFYSPVLLEVFRKSRKTGHPYLEMGFDWHRCLQIFRFSETIFLWRSRQMPNLRELLL